MLFTSCGEREKERGFVVFPFILLSITPPSRHLKYPGRQGEVIPQNEQAEFNLWLGQFAFTDILGNSR